jgi:hypothetical protein
MVGVLGMLSECEIRREKCGQIWMHVTEVDGQDSVNGLLTVYQILVYSPGIIWALRLWLSVVDIRNFEKPTLKFRE